MRGPLVHHLFIDRCRRQPFQFFCGDSRKPRLSFFAGLVGSIAFARKMRAFWKSDERVGILLPASVGAVISNLAATISGRTVVNLNFTLGFETMKTSVRQAKLRTILTSKEFLRHLDIQNIETLGEIIYIEDVAASISNFDRFLAIVLTFLPKVLIEKFSGAQKLRSADDDLVIIFSSGSVGDPKGIQLTHRNITENLKAIQSVFQTMAGQDSFLGILPLFHSFGYIITWYAALCGLGLPLHANPLDAKKVGELVADYKVTILLATPTFLQLYLRRCHPDQFKSLRLVITGAERLPEALEIAFEKQFGIRPLSAYGATECSPGIAVTSPTDPRSNSVGKALPGVSLKILDLETAKELGPDESGMIYVKGPNVMKGYLDKPEATAEVISDGWYKTGDIGTLDANGYLRVTDRFSRFSKIAGEMVPHGRVEDALHQVAGTLDRTFVVTGIEDENKGEALVVIHTFPEEKIPTLLNELSRLNLPNLFIPRRDRFVRVQDLPQLGSGKIDLRAAKRLAIENLVKRSA